MKKIIGYLRTQLREDFDLSSYVIAGIFLAISIIINYATDFNDNYVDAQPGMWRVLANFAFFGFAYFVPIVIRCAILREWSLLSAGFVFKSAFGILVLSLDSGFPYINEWLSKVPHAIHIWLFKVTINMMSGITVLLPIALYHWFIEKNRCKTYGLGNTTFDWSPYLFMLLIMMPLIAGAAAFSEGFQHQYPMFPKTKAHEYLHVPKAFTILTYEVAYGLDFITVELLFRGFFVVGMISLLGRRAILPMATMYCYLHFGKPAGEAISSIFGGYVLGVIAYETKSIWGGITVHVGIAWMMEIAAYLEEL